MIVYLNFTRKQFLRYTVKESFVNLKKFRGTHDIFCKIRKNGRPYSRSTGAGSTTLVPVLQKKIFKSTKLSSIQRNSFFDRISKKLFSGCRSFAKFLIFYSNIKIKIHYK